MKTFNQNSFCITTGKSKSLAEINFALYFKVIIHFPSHQITYFWCFVWGSCTEVRMKTRETHAFLFFTSNFWFIYPSEYLHIIVCEYVYMYCIHTHIYAHKYFFYIFLIYWNEELECVRMWEGRKEKWKEGGKKERIKKTWFKIQMPLGLQYGRIPSTSQPQLVCSTPPPTMINTFTIYYSG